VAVRSDIRTVEGREYLTIEVLRSAAAGALAGDVPLESVT